MLPKQDSVVRRADDHVIRGEDEIELDLLVDDLQPHVSALILRAVVVQNFQRRAPQGDFLLPVFYVAKQLKLGKSHLLGC